MNHSIVLGPHGQTEDLRTGKITLPGITLDFIAVKRMPDAYRDMARTQPYHISEMAPAAYLMAVAAGAPITALPIPMTRRFRHNGLLKRHNAGITVPKDLEGRKIGIRAYSITAAIWTRGILEDEYGLNPKHVTWLTEEEESTPGYIPPANVARIPHGHTLGKMIQTGGIDAGFAGLAGLGDAASEGLDDVVAASANDEAAWFRKTGIYPLHGVIVVRNDVLTDTPDLPTILFDGLLASKQNYLLRIAQGSAASAEDLRYKKLSGLVGDPLPYGLAENRASFESLVRYCVSQGLIQNPPAIEMLFPDPRQGAVRPARWS